MPIVKTYFRICSGGLQGFGVLVGITSYFQCSAEQGAAVRNGKKDKKLEDLKMIEKMTESSGNVLGYKFTGTITVDDFKKMEPEVDALVQKEGNVRILFNLTGFKWEKIDALVADLKFGHKFHEKIQKLAVVGDKTWEKWITQLALRFYAKEAKYFPSADTAKAWSWLRE